MELDARGGLAGARGLAQVHMAIVQVRASRSRFRPLVLETARCCREHRLGAHACALHMSPWVASMCSWHCEGRTSAWREALCHQRRVPDAHVPSHGGGSAAALASDGLRVPLLRCRVSHEPSPRLRAREGFPCFAAGSATNHRRDAASRRWAEGSLDLLQGQRALNTQTFVANSR